MHTHEVCLGLLQAAVLRLEWLMPKIVQLLLQQTPTICITSEFSSTIYTSDWQKFQSLIKDISVEARYLHQLRNNQVVNGTGETFDKVHRTL